MKQENEQDQVQDNGKTASRRAFFTGVTGVALAGTAAAASVSGSGSGSELKNRLMSRIQNELKTADESELHSYDRGETVHNRYVKA